MESPDAARKKKGKCFCVYKATGLGLTEFILLWVLWKSYTDEWFSGKEAMIITGPNVDLAQDLILRSKSFLLKRGLGYVDHGAYELEVNGARIKCYPSNNIHSARGKPKVSIFFGDEAAFFKLRDDSIVRTVGERYIGKSDSWVVWVSTAGEEPSGFFYDIMQEQESETIYKRFHFYVEAGLKRDKQTKSSIFTKAYIDEASKARSFEREYLGVWGKNVGDIFSPEGIELCCNEEYDWSDSDDTNDRIIGIDPGFGSSEFGVCIMQKHKGKKAVIFAESYERASYIDMVDKLVALSKRFKTKRIFADASWTEGIRDLRDKHHMNVQAIAFNQYGEKMLNYAANHIDFQNVKIHPVFKKLKSQLMTIKYNKKGGTDKTKQNPFDLGDAFLLALYYYKMGSGTLAGIA
ncbi:MAG: terminase family protein [Pelagibacteraceae bacterium]